MVRPLKKQMTFEDDSRDLSYLVDNNFKTLIEGRRNNFHPRIEKTKKSCIGSNHDNNNNPAYAGTTWSFPSHGTTGCLGSGTDIYPGVFPMQS